MALKAMHRCRLLEPVYDVSGSRCEIRLQPDTVYYADARLLNVGGTGTATAYNSLLGATAVIRSIGLYDGATPIDTIQDFTQYRPLQALNVPNDGAISVGRYTKHDDIGYICEGIEEMGGDFGQGLDISIAQPSNAVGDQAWLSLRSVFPFLASSVILPTNIFRQLRIVIEWNTPAQMVNLVVLQAANDVASSRPLLAIDELMPSPERDFALKNYTPPVWSAVVKDSFILPAQAGTADNAANRVIPQQTNQKLRGFNGQYVRDMVVKFTPLTVPNDGAGNNDPFGAVGSVSQWLPAVQFVVNGRNLFPRKGIEGKMRALAHYTDSLGSIPTFFAQYAQGVVFNENGISTKLQDTVGSLYLVGADVESLVEDLQINIDRSAVYNNPDTTASYRINVFGRCSRRLVLEPGAGTLDTRYKILTG